MASRACWGLYPCNSLPSNAQQRNVYARAVWIHGNALQPFPAVFNFRCISKINGKLSKYVFECLQKLWQPQHAANNNSVCIQRRQVNGVGMRGGWFALARHCCCCRRSNAVTKRTDRCWPLQIFAYSYILRIRRDVCVCVWLLEFIYVSVCRMPVRRKTQSSLAYSVN